MRRSSAPPQSLCSQQQPPQKPHWPALDLLASPVQSTSSPQQLRRLRTPSGESANQQQQQQLQQPLRQCVEFYDVPGDAAASVHTADAGNGGGGGFSSRSPSPPKKVPEAAAAAAAAAAVAAVAAARPPSLSRSNRGGSLRGSPVLRVLPDRALPSKANSSESLSSASDLSSLTSLVQRKRQESPEPQAPLLPTASVSTTGRIGGRPSGPSGQSQESEDSSESPAEDSQQQQQQQQQAAQASYLGDFSDSQGQSSLCLEFLMLDAQSRTAPQIRQPSARQVKADHQQQQQQQPKADAAPPGAASRPAGLGSSPPKAVSFNLNHEVNTFEKEESTDQRRRRSSHHHQHGKARKEQAADSRISDSGLVDTHAALIDAMLNTVRKQLDCLSLVKEQRISMEHYRDMMKSLLAKQTKTIQQILDAIQANEKYS
ncbi:hypothetical protein BOX15_Mlig009383g1 [Macrostomum lignano]|uniref:Uncharacterized protein n=1 Tax=Macrostomum lignano TaxID=282301 RepID=A0A267EQ34_9PLAT|nr:hypothetical protein BOX15_Mlig009383g1 [Macrostomum lignano]